MLLQLTRVFDDKLRTIGIMKVDGKPECFSLEDAFHEEKVWGKTRIPRGSYEIKLRTEGGMHKKYSKKYDWHKGMLWLQDVENFEWVYIHIGNDEEDTDGCILTGTNWNMRGNTITGSALAYKTLYQKIISQLQAGYPVNIEVN